MIRALKWIWEQVCNLGTLVASLASNVWTWFVAGLSLVAEEFISWITSAVSGVFPSVTWPSIVSDSSELFRAIVYHFSLDRAAVAIGVCIVAWCTARVARLAMVPIRALLELL